MEIIGEIDKNYPPFVNICLRTWMERLSVDADIWTDLYLFNFDKWLVNKLKEPLLKEHGGKTSYELMMAVFGNIKETKDAPPPKNGQALSDKAPIASRPSLARISKLQKVGKTARGRLIKSHCYRGSQNSLNKAYC